MLVFKTQSHCCFPDLLYSSPRPLTPGGASLLRAAADAGAQALSVLRQAAVSMAAIGPTLGSTTDCFAYRGKVTSLGDAAVTLRGHLGVLLGDACVAAARGFGGEAAQMLERQQEVRSHCFHVSRLCSMLLPARGVYSSGMNAGAAATGCPRLLKA